MKKHSPNFHTNLEEADNAKNNPVSTFFWTVVLVATLMLGFSLTSCEKPAQSKEKIPNTEFELEYLFEKDGCKMYRFYDGMRYIY